MERRIAAQIFDFSAFIATRYGVRQPGQTVLPRPVTAQPVDPDQ
jgi:hypothetical protein